MTPQKAIECIDEVLCATVHYDETLEYELTTDDTEWLEMAKEALEKQISKRPHNIKTAPSDCYISYGDCPCCNADVFEYQHYCIDCGQKLDWGDEE